MPVTATTGRVAVYKYELPTLDFKLGSLTEGTNIPPPLPSPVTEEPTPPQTPPSSTETDANKNEQQSDANRLKTPSDTTGANPHTAADLAPSPPNMARTGSMRRLLSRGLLHGPNANGGASAVPGYTGSVADVDSMKRPASRATTAVMESGRKSKRSSGWFGRLRSGSGGEGKRLSTMAPEMVAPAPVTTPGPPPPRIPELSELKSKVDIDDEGSLGGGDLFKDIK